jgi:uracil-DNA glycosylase
MELEQAVETIRINLKSQNDFSTNPIDLILPFIPPFRCKGDIKLIIIGQDPTIRNEISRKNITCTLNLNKGNSLRTYIDTICNGLGITIENVYATNLFKYFYTVPPASTLTVLLNHLEPNLTLLQTELAEFKDAAILTLGEPVLQLLTNENSKVRVFWDYNAETGSSNDNFTFSLAKENKLKKDFFPFPHQPSMQKKFYKNTIDDYLIFLKKKTKHQIL